MRTPALLGALLLQTMLTPSARIAGQSFTHVPAGLSLGAFDGVGVGLSAGLGSWNTPYDITYEPGRRRGDYGGGYGSWGGYRGGGDPADYCWDRAWQLRWDHSYFEWYGPARYDHLDLYQDCLRFGAGYAYDRWRWRAYSAARFHRSWVRVSVLVLDPFWRPWGPSWAYDPWGWYWDGWRYGPGWHGPWGGIGYAGAVWSTPRVGAVYAPRGTVLVARPSPLVTPRFKEDPRGVAPNPAGARRAVPRGERVAAPPTRAGQSGTRPALADAPRPSDRSRRPLSPALSGPGGARAPSVRGGAPSPRRGESATARPTPPARAGRSRPAAPAARPRTGRPRPAGPPAAAARGGKSPAGAGGLARGRADPPARRPCQR